MKNQVSIKYLSRIAMMTAVSVVLRQFFLWIPNVQPITALFFVLTIYWKLKDTLLVMALSLLITGMLDGFGIWVGAQIIVYALLIVCWSSIYKKITNFFVQLIIVGVLSFFYGFGINFLTAPLFKAKNFWAFCLSGMSFDLMHAVATIMSYPLILKVFILNKPFNKLKHKP
ncbi:MAG: hypothetical protein LBS28_03325 [Streptococcaceae bacterium]|jgi:hypothetical protein|nr:hypothetical protein [Streptococcaceae bacterium]